MVTRAKSVREEMHIRGEWWFADEPSLRSRGTLTGCSATSFKLSLENGFEDSFKNARQDAIIHGIDENKRRITLLQCFMTRCSPFAEPLGLPARARYHATWVLLGEHFKDYASLRFVRATFGLRHLEAWYDLTGSYKVAVDMKKRRTSVELIPPPEIVIAEHSGVMLRLTTQVQPPGWRVAQVEAAIRHGIRISVEPTKDSMQLASFDNSTTPHLTLTDAIDRLSTLLSFATSQETHAFDVKGFIPDRSSPVEIHGAQHVPESEEAYLRGKMLLPWLYIADMPKLRVEHWFSAYEQFGASLYCYFNAKKRGPYTGARFASIVQALEGLHLAKNPKLTNSEKRVRRELRAAVEKLIAKHPSWAGLGISHNIGFSLSERLRALFIEFEKEVVAAVGTSGRMDRELQRIVDTRNGLAHGASNTTKMLQGRDLYLATKLLLLVTELHFLKAMQLPLETIRSVTKRRIESLRKEYDGV